MNQLHGDERPPVEHPNVCNVYEVGELDGRPFIAMQLVHGQPLAALAHELPLGERVRLMRDVADAIEAAHAHGIVHRDIKPSNIMIERRRDGTNKAYVTDFGLAREVEQDGATRSGSLVGTPLYMAPEQARGDVRATDRRTDVYAIGATLYTIAIDRPPFAASTTVDLLLKILHEPPPSPRAVLPSLPRDLETVILKCLEKEPGSRYQSARDLASDLDRFLRGESIRARRPGALVTAARAVKRHRALSLISLAAVLVSSVLAFVAVRERMGSAARMRLGRELGQKSKELESRLRIAKMLPLHDTVPERHQVREQIAAIERSLGQPRGAEPVQRYAIGRGLLALGDLDGARANLEDAWARGYQEPEVAVALGLATGQIYRRELEKLASFRPEERVSLRRELQQRYRDRALTYLRRGGAAGADVPLYVEGLIDYYEDRYEDAAKKAEAAFAASGGSFYEALKLRGDAVYMRALARHTRGDGAGADALCAEAGRAYQDAIAIGRSDADLYWAECRRQAMRLAWAVDGGGEPRALFADAVRACDAALATNSESALPLKTKADVYLRMVESGEAHEGGCGAAPATALGFAEESVRRSRDWESLAMLGEVHTWSAIECQKRDPRPSLERARVAFEQSIALMPSGRSHRGLGVVHHQLAEWAVGHGADPEVELDASVAAYEKALAIEPEVETSLANLLNIFSARGNYALAHGVDPSANVSAALPYFRQAIALFPTDPYAYNNFGGIYDNQVLYDALSGHDPRKDVDAASEYLRKAVAINPRYFPALANLAEVKVTVARWAADHGVDDQHLASDGRAAIADALRVDGADPFVWAQKGLLEVALARIEKRHGRSGGTSMGAARAAVARASAAGDADVLANIADVQRWLAVWDSTAERRRADVAAGLTLVQRALAANPSHALAHAVDGELRLLQAGDLPSPRREQALADARAAFERAFAVNPLLKLTYGVNGERAAASR
jgi:serine/threonine-protein kinase